MEPHGCSMAAIMYMVTLFLGWLLCIDSQITVNHNLSQHTDVPKAWIVHLNDAADEQGHGVVKFTMNDILYEVPVLHSVSWAYLFFYEHGELEEWSDFQSNNRYFEVRWMNSQRQRHRTIKAFTINSEETYITRWRSTDILNKIIHWNHRFSADKEIKLVMQKIGDSDTTNLRFQTHSETRPFLLIGVKYNDAPSIHGYDLAARLRRNVPITEACVGESSNQPCCIAKQVVDLDDHVTTMGWWLSPRNFEMRYCKGVCKSEESYYYKILRIYSSSSLLSCCRPKQFEPFEIQHRLDGILQKSQLMKFQVETCECM